MAPKRALLLPRPVEAATYYCEPTDAVVDMDEPTKSGAYLTLSARPYDWDGE